MSFNFTNFMDAMAKLLPAVGEAVIALHPGDAPEAMKIQFGTQLIGILAASLHQTVVSQTVDAPPPVATAPTVDPAAAPAAQ